MNGYITREEAFRHIHILNTGNMIGHTHNPLAIINDTNPRFRRPKETGGFAFIQHAFPDVKWLTPSS